MKYFKDPSTGKVYFSTTRDGKPTKIQRTVFAEVFYCMAMAGLAKATQQTKYKVYFHVPYHLAFYEVFLRWHCSRWHCSRSKTMLCYALLPLFNTSAAGWKGCLTTPGAAGTG